MDDSSSSPSQAAATTLVKAFQSLILASTPMALDRVLDNERAARFIR